MKTRKQEKLTQVLNILENNKDENRKYTCETFSKQRHP